MARFEIRDGDAAGRIGRLEIPRAETTVTTPALLPVVNPHVQTIPPRRLSDLGAEILITNAYVLHGSDEFQTAVREDGVHEVLGFDGAIMTDSGSFQLAEYGELDVSTEEILRFQHRIGSDIATPVDIPTPPDASHEQATADLEQTHHRLNVAAEFEAGEMLITAPIQGALFQDLRETAAIDASETGLDVFPIGGVVPLMSDYRFADMVDVVAAAKRGLPSDAPVHLFGAGHPMMFALAVALGCDLFDSAAYALYARDGRYFTVRGTAHLEDLEEFPCTCPICSEITPAELREKDTADQEEKLAVHNLYVSFSEIRRIRQALRDGRLFELVDARARGHPALVDGYRTLYEYVEQLEAHSPIASNAFFYVSGESASRPTVVRYQSRLDRLTPPDKLVLSEHTTPPETDEVVWSLIPPFGPVPPELQETMPLAAEVPARMDAAGYEAAAEGVAQLVAAHPEVEVTVIHDGWPQSALTKLPEAVDIRAAKESPQSEANHAE